MEKVSKLECRPDNGKPKLSKYAEKQRARLVPKSELAKELAKLPEPVFIHRDRGLKAVVPPFYSRDNFMFLRTTDGERLFLSKQTIKKSGFELNPNDVIHCDVKVAPGKSTRRVVFIHKVEPPGRY